MKNKILAAGVILVISVLCAGPVFSWGGACGSKAIARELGLTPEQDKLLKEAKESSRSRMMELKKALKAKKEELGDALAKPGATKKEAEPIAAEVKSLQSQMVDQKIDGILRVKGILTPEQFQKMQAKHEERRKSGHMKHHKKGW